MCSLSVECVLWLQYEDHVSLLRQENVFSYYRRRCSLTIECVLLLQYDEYVALLRRRQERIADMQVCVCVCVCVLSERARVGG